MVLDYRVRAKMPVLSTGYVISLKIISLNPNPLNRTGFLTLTLITAAMYSTWLRKVKITN
jgi:hypothetical protein